jgi:hypothetical protein
MAAAYEYCRNANVIAMCWFDSGVNAPDGPWLLDKDWQGNTESPAERLVQYKTLMLNSHSKLIPAGGLAA